MDGRLVGWMEGWLVGMMARSAMDSWIHGRLMIHMDGWIFIWMQG